MMEPLLIFEPDGVGGKQQVWSVSPALEEPSKVLPAQLVPLVIVKLGPLTVLVAHQGQAGISDYLKAFVFELEAVVDVQIPVEAEALAH